MDGLPGMAPGGPPIEDPPWSGWDVLALAALTLVTIGVCVLLVGYVVHSYFLPALASSYACCHLPFCFQCRSTCRWMNSSKRPAMLTSSPRLESCLLPSSRNCSSVASSTPCWRA